MPDRNKDVTEILQERGDVYGDYKGGLQFRNALTQLINKRHHDVHGEFMDSSDLLHFNDIVGKLSRLAVSPRHVDSWKDVAGYALLVEEVIKHGSK